MHKHRHLTRCAAGAALSTALFTGLLGAAAAGECPADKVAANALPGAATTPVGVTDDELASIDLSIADIVNDKKRETMKDMM
jgi:hypothetical protein